LFLRFNRYRNLNNLKTKFKRDQRRRNAHKKFVLFTLTTRATSNSHKPLGNPLSNQNQITNTTHQSSDLKPLKKHTTFGKPHQECWSWTPQEHTKLFAIQLQKYIRLRKGLHLIKVQQKIIQLQSYSTFTWKSKAWCEYWKLEIKFVKLNFSKLLLTLQKHITNYIYFQRLVKTFNEGAYSVRNHLRQIHQLKLNSVRTFKETIGWKHETTDWFGLTVKSTKSNNFQPFLRAKQLVDSTKHVFLFTWLEKHLF